MQVDRKSLNLVNLSDWLLQLALSIFHSHLPFFVFAIQLKQLSHKKGFMMWSLVSLELGLLIRENCSFQQLYLTIGIMVIGKNRFFLFKNYLGLDKCRRKDKRVRFAQFNNCTDESHESRIWFLPVPFHNIPGSNWR